MPAPAAHGIISSKTRDTGEKESIAWRASLFTNPTTATPSGTPAGWPRTWAAARCPAGRCGPRTWPAATPSSTAADCTPAASPGRGFLDGRLLGKRLALFTCGLADPANPENAAALARAAERALPPPLRATAAVFHLQGGIDYPRLRRTHRAMMAMLRATLANRDPASLREEDRELLRTYGQVVDFTDRAALAPLLAWARGERDAAPAGPD